MKKLILLTLFAFQFALWLPAQIIADFETVGTTPDFTAEGSYGVVDNPDATGSNPSAKVGYYKKITGNWHYVTMNFPSGVNIGYNNTLTFKLRCSSQGRIFAKFWNGSQVLIESWAPDWAFQPPANTWVECKMDLTPAMQKQFTQLQLAACVDNPSEAEADVWFDDVKLSNPELGDGSPKVLFTVSKNKVFIGEEILFDASESYDYDGQITDYLWDFGDGSTANGVEATHTYLQDSIYTLNLTLTDNDGKKSSASTTLFVMDPDQKLSNLSIVTQQPETNKKIEGIFQINASYTNVYNPDEVKADAEITCPDGKIITIPCFYYMKARLENTVWTADSSYQAWMFRFNTEQVGTHTIVVKVIDESGMVSSDITEIEVAQGNSKGFVHNDASNHQYYRHTTGEPFYPMGINIGWNNIPNYTQTIQNLSVSKANTFRYWHTPFAQQALEWKKTTFYDGLGYYSQKAAAMTDSLMNLGEATDVFMQLAIFQHGMFSENVNEMWADNPYNLTNGGYVARAEEYFRNEDCKKQTKKLLRYIVGRWGYSKNLFSWEFFNEVQFTGIHNSQTAQWWPGVMTWHSEMSQYMASIDPFNHIQTTSASDDQIIQLDTIKELDVLQYHLYSDKMLDDQVIRDFDFRNKLNNASIINGEYGTNVEADVPMDMQRNAIWNGIMTQVPHYMWIWEHYLDLSWAGLFTMPMNFLAEEDFGAETTLDSYPVSIKHATKTFKTLGVSTGKNFYGYIYEPNYSNNITGAVCELQNIPFAYYTLTYYLPVSGEVIKTEKVALIQLTNQLQLPEFSKGIAFKIKYESAYNLPIAIAGNDTVVAPGMTVSFSGALSVSQTSNPLTFNWKINEKPGSSTLQISNPTQQDIYFVPDVAGIYKISLTVSDGANNSAPDVVTITASNRPVAVLAADTTLQIGEKYFYCDGSNSYDVDGDALTYSWRLISMPTDSKGQLYQIDQPISILRLDKVGEFVLELTVTDGISNSEAETIKVNVLPTGIFDSDLVSKISLYPNPTLGTVTVNTGEGLLIEQLEVLDVTGRIIKIPKLEIKSSEITWNMNQLTEQSGIFLIKLIINKQIIYKTLLFNK